MVIMKDFSSMKVMVVISKHFLKPLVNSPGHQTPPQVSRANHIHWYLVEERTASRFLDVKVKKGFMI